MIVHLANPSAEASSYVSEAEPHLLKPISVLWGNYGGLGRMTSDRGDVWKKKQWWLLKRLGRMLLYHQLYQNQGVYFIDRRATMETFFDGQDVSTLLSTASARA